jgi:signal transduction histidine kinase/CheY-like chemotaxis protein/HPt (histidine-containing phosphotransfer) domain-containing protein
VLISPNNLSPDPSIMAALQGIQQPVALIDSASKVRWHSAKLSELLAASEKGLSGLSLLDALRSRAQGAEGLNKFADALTSLKPTEFNMEMLGATGIPCKFKLIVSPVNMDAQVPTEFWVTFSDVSEIESLRASVERTSQLNGVLFDCVQAGMGEWRLDEKFITLGPRLAVMIGDLPAAWMKRPAIDLFNRFHPDDTAFFSQQVEELHERKLDRIHSEFRLKHTDDYWVALLARGQVTARTADGQASCISFVFIDVTELRHQDSRWKNRAQLSSDWFWATDDCGNLAEVSPEVGSLLNCNTNDLLGQPLLEVLRLVGCVPLEPLDMSQFGAKKVVKGRLVRFDRPFMPTAWFELDAMPRYDFRGDFIGYEGVGRNVTKRQLQELELLEAKQVAEHSNKSKSIFLATMSHEIRTPMNGVLGMAEMLSTGILDDEQAESVTIIRQSATHLLSLIDSILDFSKLEADRVEIEERQVHIDDVIYGLAESLLPVAKAKAVRLRAYSDPSLPPLLLDDTRLRQVLNNFVSNAIKFSSSEVDANGEVYVRAEIQDGNLLKISVSDNGIGIAPQQLQSVFEAFHQAEVSTTRRFGGTGLGLAISKKLIDLMGGMIKVDSELGKGSTFTLLLPMKAAGEVIASQKELRAKHCVVVGQDTQENVDLQLVLRNAGATAFLVKDIGAAFNAMHSVLRPTVFVHADVGSSEHAYASEVKKREWASEVSHLLITDGSRKSLRMIEENIACADWGRAKVMVHAVCLMTQDRSQIPRSSAAASKRLIGMGMPKTVEKISGDIKVLVAEDDPINQRVISRQLSHLGVKADFANTGREALDMWMENNHYSLILTDLHMPVMDGYEFTRRVRALESESEHIPIIALTANAVTGETFEAYKAGIDLYLTKPILLADLSVAIATFAVDLSQPKTVQAVEIATPVSTSEQSLSDFDFDTVVSIIGDDQDLIRDLIEQYLEDLEAAAMEIEKARAKSDAKQVKFLAHRLKSSSKSVGALKLGAIFTALELAPLPDTSVSSNETSEQIHLAIIAFRQAIAATFKEIQN